MRTVPRLLVIDDDPLIQAIVFEVFDTDDYEVRCAANGQEALDVLDHWSADLILLDLRMPVMDGHTFRVLQRHHPTAFKVPIVLITAARELRGIAKQLQPVSILPKPFCADDLVTTVARALAAA